MEPVRELNRLITATELSATTGIPKSRVFQLAREGQLPCIRLGRAMRFDPKAVKEWLAAGGTAGAGPKG
jgi:excisionase family DNA binding protein